MEVSSPGAHVAADSQAVRMNGADVLADVLLANDVAVCFANPGTSEMHFVAALDRKPELRCVLGLSEGVVTGAADGYARMTGRPAATLLHTGPGLANGLANLHNARRARTPMINIVGDHASYHLPLDAPLTTRHRRTGSADVELGASCQRFPGCWPRSGGGLSRLVIAAGSCDDDPACGCRVG